jgi:integrase
LSTRSTDKISFSTIFCAEISNRATPVCFRFASKLEAALMLGSRRFGGKSSVSRLTKRVVDNLRPDPAREIFVWDDEINGFGVRVQPTGLKTYVVQYRTTIGQQRRMAIGRHGVVTTDQARTVARKHLAHVTLGEDPSAARKAARKFMTVAEVCDWYLEEAEAGRLLGRRRRPIKASSLKMDRSRIDAHIKPLLGKLPVAALKLADVEDMQADIAAGKTAKPRIGSRGGATTGGEGTAARSVSTLRSLLSHARRRGLIDNNPAMGARIFAGNVRERRLSETELRAFGLAMRSVAQEGEHPTGLAAIRLLLLTGFRRMEGLGLQRAWLVERRAIQFPDTKSGPQLRYVGAAAVELIEAQPIVDGSPFVFPADWGEGHFIGVVRVLDRVRARANLTDVTPHVLRHTFASIAGDMGFSELTIRALLGHAASGVTQRYVHLDTVLGIAADKVAATIAGLLDGAITVPARLDPTEIEPALKQFA